MSIASTPLRRLTLSAVVMAAYVAVMYLTQSFAFGAVQIRIATALYALTYLFPFLTLPLALANSLSNLVMGGLGLLDIGGGFVAGLVTCLALCLLRRLRLPFWTTAIPVLLGPALIVAIWLSALLHIPYTAMALSLLAGQLLPAIVGAGLVRAMESRLHLQPSQS